MSDAAGVRNLLAGLVRLGGVLCAAGCWAAAGLTGARLNFQGEAGKGAGVVMMRGRASGDRTRYLTLEGQEVAWSFTVASYRSADLLLQYSNDGGEDELAVLIDDTEVGRFRTEPTGSGGYGWNQFREVSLALPVSVTAGARRLRLRVVSCDPYGVEIDRLTLLPYAVEPEGASATAGMACQIPFPAEVAGAAEVSVRGALPPGLRHVPGSDRLEGVPARAGAWAVTLVAPGRPVTGLRVEVGALPVWAQGAFNGAVEGLGAAVMSVSAGGRISGRLDWGGVDCPFEAPSYEAGGDEAGGYVCHAVAKPKGRPSFAFEMRVTALDAGLGLGLAQGEAGDGRKSGEGLYAVRLWRDIWREAPGRLAPYVGYYTAVLPGCGAYGSGWLTLTVDERGRFKGAGRLADGSAPVVAGTLAADGEGRVFAVVAPKAKAGGSRLFGVAELVAQEGGVPVLQTLGGRFVWSSDDPQATGEYGAGFRRALEVSGGWYDRLDGLRDAYLERGGGWVVEVSATNGPPVRVGSGGSVERPELWDPSGVAVEAVVRNGRLAGFEAEAAHRPVGPDGEGGWSYTAANTAGLRFSLVQATGLFSGSFSVWFEREGTPEAVRVPFSGAVTLSRAEGERGAEGRGYFLWPGRGEGPAVGATYPYPQSYDFVLREGTE